MKRSGWWLLGVVVGLLSGVTVEGGASPTDKLKVAVTIEPQAYFVEQIGGELVDVLVLVGPGQSPHSYEPTPRQMTALAECSVYLRIGVDFERGFVPRLQRALPKLKIVDTRRGVPMRELEAGHSHANHEHADGHKHEHEHGHEQHAEGKTQDGVDDGVAKDPHIWLSPKLVKIQARTMCDALVELDPQHADDYRKRLARFEAELDKLHDEIAEVLKPLKGRDVFVFHPAYGYFLDEFGLKQVPVEIEGKSPTPRELAKLIEQAREQRVQVVFVQPQFSPRSAETLAQAISGVVVSLDPLARDYTTNLRSMAAAIRKGLDRQ